MQKLECDIPFDIPISIGELSCENPVVTSLLFKRLVLSLSDISFVSSTELQFIPRQPDIADTLSNNLVQESHSWIWFFRFSDNLQRAIKVIGTDGFTNIAHPVVKYARSLLYKLQEECSPIELMTRLLMYGLVGGPIDANVDANSWYGTNRKRLGLLFRAIEWNTVPHDLRPPYYFFRPGIGMETLEEDRLNSWADI